MTGPKTTEIASLLSPVVIDADGRYTEGETATIFVQRLHEFQALPGAGLKIEQLVRLTPIPAAGRPDIALPGLHRSHPDKPGLPWRCLLTKTVPCWSICAAK